MISLKRLRQFWQKHAAAEGPLRHWYKLTLAANWSNLTQTRATFPHADEVRVASGASVTVFNAGGNDYRVVATIIYPYRRVYVRLVMTHAEYSKDRWKNLL